MSRSLALAAGSPRSRCRRSQPHYFFRVPGILDQAGECGVLHFSLVPLCMAMQLLALVVRPRGTYIRVSGECHSILLHSQSVPDKLSMCHTTHHGRTLGSHVARGSRRFPEAVFETSLLLHPIESAIDSPMSFVCWHDTIGVRPLSTVEVRGASGSSPGWVVSGA
jgi:hypothetical protein